LNYDVPHLVPETKIANEKIILEMEKIISG